MKPLKILAIIVAGLWLNACTHTGTPQTPEPTKKETTESKAENQKTSSEAPESKPQGDKKKSETSQTPSQSAAKAAPKQAEQSKSASRTASPDATESEPQEAQGKPPTSSSASQKAKSTKTKASREKTSESPATSSNTADSKLEKARENLRISQETEKRIAAELEQLKNSGKASADDIRNYEAYHESVQAMVEENRKMVEKMEAVYAKSSQDKKTSSATDSGEMEQMLDPKIPEEQTQDKVAALDRQLNASLSEFDEKLLKEMDAIRAESATRMRDLAQEAAEAAKRLRESGAQADSSEAQEEGDEQDQGAESKTGEEMESDKSTAGTQTASGDQTRQGGQGATREEQRRAGYEDDDIVARQLREAAENETDPELKEKLWKEYEDYKKNK